MKSVIRRGVFETNSSSSHSISISGGNYTPDTLMVANGVCRIYPGEFGWEEESYRDAATKASYCLTHAKQCGDERSLDMLRDVIARETGAAVEFCKADSDWHEWGYIDHQSIEYGVPQEAFASADALRDFIFNPASVLRTDNDNH